MSSACDPSAHVPPDGWVASLPPCRETASDWTAGPAIGTSSDLDATSSTREPSALDLPDRDDNGECCTHAEYLSTCHSRGVSAPNPVVESPSARCPDQAGGAPEPPAARRSLSIAPAVLS